MQAIEEEAQRRRLNMHFNPGTDHADQGIQDYKVCVFPFMLHTLMHAHNHGTEQGIRDYNVFC